MPRALALGCVLGLVAIPSAALSEPANKGAAAAQTTGFPAPPRAPAGAPNVLLIMTDDAGFAASSTFGGLVPTPNLDALAAGGLRYNEFHTTAMCSPSRAALLTGRNHHAVGMGILIDLTTPEPGYNGRIPKSAGTIAEILKNNGYNTAFFGKHHDTPAAESSASGPFDRWPTNLGFEYFYGFIGAQTDQWHPGLVRGTTRITPPTGEVLDKMLADDAVRWIHNQKAAAPDKPFFIYYAPASVHAPHQAPREWIDKFRGKFDQGWDKARDEAFARQKAMGIIPANTDLTPRPDIVPAWESLTPDQKRVAARLMEVYAGELAYQDHEFGEIIAELKRMGQFDNTLVIFIEGDNGASSEGGTFGTSNDTGTLVNHQEEPTSWLVANLDKFGGPDAHNHYPMGWAWAADTPFQWFKRFASHLGGIRNGMVLSWPSRIHGDGGVRSQFTHLIDVMPTILEATGVKSPAMIDGVPQQRIDGTSMSYTFDAANAPERHRVQYFELLGNRSIYSDGWIASTTPPLDALDTTVHVGHTDPKDYKWELYNLHEDYSQAHDLAAKYPDRLKSLQALWMSEAKRNNVLPIDNTVSGERRFAEPNALLPARPRYVYWGKDVSVEQNASPPVMRHSFTLTADVDIPAAKATGVLVALGNQFDGWSFYLKDGRPVAYESFAQQPRYQYRIAGTDRIPAGAATISYQVSYRQPRGTGADVTIAVNGKNVASGFFPKTINMTDITENFDVGHDSDATVSNEYPGDGLFPGTIKKLTVDLLDLKSTAPAAKGN